MTATREMAKESRKIAERVKTTFGETGTAVTKAKLFDEKMHEEKKLSGSRMVRILNDFAKQVEAAMTEARKAADRMEESSRKLTGATCSKGINLSDISLPDLFPDTIVPKGGKDRTPKSKKQGKQASMAETPSSRIDLDSTPGSDNRVLGAAGERSRNLNDVFEEMDPGTKSPSVGSRL